MAAVHRKTGLQAEAPSKKLSEVTAPVEIHESKDEGELFTEEIRQQLDSVFSRMAQPLRLKLYLDDRSISAELESFIASLAALSDKLSVEVADRNADAAIAPCVEVCLADGSETGLAFHGVPGGHEFTSFVLGLYNAAGPGQALEEATRQQIASIVNKTDLKILVTLSCTMCPDLVVAAQRIAAANPNVTAHVYDIRHFEDLKNRHKVMSVPCLVINDENLSFGKKTLPEILKLIQP